jgi:hypothetical protein
MSFRIDVQAAPGEPDTPLAVWASAAAHYRLAMAAGSAETRRQNARFGIGCTLR